MNEDTPEILVVFFDAVIHRFDMLLVEKSNHFFLQSSRSLPWNYLHEFDLLIHRFLYYAVEFGVDLPTLVVDVMQV